MVFGIINGGVVRFGLCTLPFLAVSIFLLYKAWDRTHWHNYVEGGHTFSLMDLMVVFLSFHVVWTLFTIHVVIFIPKRRHFLGRYLNEGEPSMGDVVYDPESRLCGRFGDYGYAIYHHPIDRTKVVRKRVRVYQAYTRERVPILRLPNRPLSGQVKTDLEIELGRMKRERDLVLWGVTVIALCWILFSMGAALYTLFQIKFLQDNGDQMIWNEQYETGLKIFLIVVGINVPCCYAMNWIRFLFYHNWMVNRAALIENEGEARKVDPWCLKKDADSVDGSDQIPYSILNADSVSYQGTIPSHSASLKKTYEAPATSTADVENNEGRRSIT